MFPEKSQVKIVSATDSLEQMKAKLESKTLDGILIVREKENGDRELDVQLLVRQQPSWLSQIQIAVNEFKSRRAVEKAAIMPDQLQQVFSPQAIEVVATVQNFVSKMDRIAAAAMGGCMVLVSFLGLSFFMVGITGEKQQRITEQIVSVISTQGEG